jgi:hypothetical protein
MKSQRLPGLIALLIAALILSFAVKADGLNLKLVPDNWTATDTKYQLAYTTIAILDAGTTADIKNHDDIEEANPVARYFLGRNPEKLETAVYFTTMAGLNYAVSAYLKPKHRRLWQRTTIVINGSIVANNYRIGLRWGF